MKKVAVLALLMSLGIFAVGCEQKKPAAPPAAPATDTATPPATDTTPPATDTAPPAEK